MVALETYRHSGRFGPWAIPLALGAGLAAAGLFASPYQGAVESNLPRLTTLLAALVYGAAIGIAIGFGYRAGKGRNVRVAAAIAVASALAGDALSFRLAYERALKGMVLSARGAADLQSLGLTEEGRTVLRSIVAGGGQVEAAREIVPFGRFLILRARHGRSIETLAGPRGKGWATYLVWLAEALVLCLVAAFAQWMIWVDRPFCERCNRWIGSRELGSIANVDYAALWASLRGGDLEAMLAPPVKERGSKRVAFHLHACPTCDRRYLTVSLGPRRTGRLKQGNPPMIEHLVVTSAQVDALELRLARKPRTP